MSRSKAQMNRMRAAAASPEARAKAKATRAKTMAAKAAAEANGVPLDMIPDAPKKRKVGRPKGSGKNGSARQAVVLALLKYLNDE